MKHLNFNVCFCVLLIFAAVKAPTTADRETSGSTVNVFAGRVVDHKGQPVSDASVAVVCDDGGHVFYKGGRRLQLFGADERFLFLFPKRNGLAKYETRSDNNGYFSIRGLKTGDVHVLAVHPQRGISVRMSVQQPNELEPMEIRLAAPTFVEVKLRGWSNSTGVSPAYNSLPLMFFNGLPTWRTTAMNTRRSNVLISPQLEPLAGDDVAKIEGRFRAGPLPVGGSWHLLAFRMVPGQNMPARNRKLIIDVKLGETTKIDFDLQKAQEAKARVSAPDG